MRAKPRVLVKRFLRRYGYALKCKALPRGLATADEADAHRRALVHIVGHKRVSLP